MTRTAWLFGLGLILAVPGGLHAAGTAFTYQGVLEDSGTASGTYDFEVRIFAATSGGTALVGPLNFADVPLDGDRFLLEVDPGAAVFTGADRWLELSVRRGDETGAYTTLAPRQLLFATPYAQHSSTADFAATVAPASITSAELANAAVTTAKIASNAVDASRIAANAVGASEIAADAVGESEIAADAVGAAEIAADAVGAAEIAADAVGAAEIAANAVGESEIASNAVGSAEIMADAVGMSEIAAGAVGSSELANGAVNASKVDTTEIQLRVDGSCPSGAFANGVAADGSLVCGSPALAEGIALASNIDQQVLSGNGASDEFDAAIGARGTPLIAYFDNVGGDLELIRCVDIGCTSVVATTLLTVGITGRNPQIEVRADGRPAIAYGDDTDGSINVLDCADIDCTSYSVTEIIDAPGLVLTDMSTLFAGNQLVLTWYDGVAGDLEVAYCSGTSPLCAGATQFTAASAGDVGSRAAVVYSINSFDPLWIAYRNDSANTLDFVVCNTSGSCDPPVSLYGPVSNTVIADKIDLVLGADNMAFVAHVRTSTTSNTAVVRTTHCDVRDCSSATHDQLPVSVSGGIPGTSILIGVDGRPSVLIGANYARCDDEVCSDAVRPIGSLSRNARLLRGVDGRDGVLSHSGATYRYLRCRNRWCSPGLPTE
ncbi:MAG: hypothetical protein KDI51_00310 [Xanthomonadales bacterium]|nr:hypothetical protein [Xanthomonadales bacterium]